MTKINYPRSLRALRTRKGWTQEQAMEVVRERARAMGLDFLKAPSILWSRWERGQVEPSAGYRVILEKMLRK